MFWIESHQALRNHPKTLKLARLLGVEKTTAIGILHCLWWWALDYAQDGDVTRYDAEDLAVACEWGGDAAQLLSSLRSVGFMDDSQLHDWEEYGGRWLKNREKYRTANADRQKRHREKMHSAKAPEGDNALLTRYGDVSNATITGQPNSTKQYQPDQPTGGALARSDDPVVSEPESPVSRDDARSRRTKSDLSIGFPFLAAYAEQTGRRPRQLTSDDVRAAEDLTTQERDRERLGEVLAWMAKTPFHGDPHKLRSVEKNWPKFEAEITEGCRCGHSDKVTQIRQSETVLLPIDRTGQGW